MSQSVQLRVAAGLNLIAACVGAVFFVLDLFRLVTRHPSGSLLFRDLAFLVFFGLGAYVFWGRYRTLSAQAPRSRPSS
jgi:hypothetical protein